MGISFIFIGFLFTLNPMLGLLDVLPDFIGYGLIFAGISRLSMISPEMNDSLGYFKWAAIVSLARFGVFLGSGSFDETMVLCMTMVFAVIEFGIMLMAMPLLSDGITYLNIRYSGNTQEDNSLKTVGIVFFAARGFLSVIPKLGALSLGADQDGDVVGEKATVDWAEFSSSLTIANIVLTLVFAAFFLTVLVKCIWKIYKDDGFISALRQAYADKKQNDPAPFIRRRLIYAFSALAVGAFFLIDLTGDGINFLPDIVFAALSLAALWLLSPYSDKTQKAYISAGVYTALSVASFIYYTIFVKTRYFMTFDKLLIMFPHEYFIAIAFAALEGVSLAVYIKYLIPVLGDVAENHVGLLVTDEFVKTKRQNEESVKSLKSKLNIYFYLICALAASGVAFTATLHCFPVYWMIHGALNIAAFVFLRHIISVFTSEINMRYEKPGE